MTDIERVLDWARLERAKQQALSNPEDYKGDKKLDLAFWKVCIAVPRSPLDSKGLEYIQPPAYSLDLPKMIATLEGAL